MFSADVSTGTQAMVSSAGAAQSGVWTHLAGVYDDARHEVRLYVNGTLAGTKAVPFTPMASDGPLLLGRTRWHDRVVDQWSGGIDEVAVYQGALTDGAVAAMFDAQAARSSVGNVLSVGETMHAGETLRSSNGSYVLSMQTDGNVVLSENGNRIWSTGTATNPGAWLMMQTDGNLVLYNGTKTALWSSKTVGATADRLVLYNDGDLAILDSAGQVLWRR